MANKLTNVLLVALLASGCSFIQSWGDYRAGDGMDAGTDGGGRIDAGDFDAGESCDFCTSEGCDPAGVECEYDSSDDCFHCVFPGLSEGDFCNNDSECDVDLICELGRCLIECFSSADCTSTIGNDDCVFGVDRSVCLDHECDPVAVNDCDAEDFCFLGPYDADDTQAGSICAVPSGTLANEGESCSPPDVECRSGHTCHDDGTGGVPVCRRLCNVADGCSDGATHACEAIGPSGSIRFLGSQLGACIPTGPLMCAGATCTAAEDCVDSVCRLPCVDATSCSASLECDDPDGDGRFHCYAPGPRNCAGDADCTGATSRCFSSFCMAPCSNDGFCSSIGFGRCINPPGSTELFCYYDCSGGVTCPPGLTCVDFDGDSRNECTP